MTGATGLIGRAIRYALTDRGDEVIALTRGPRPPSAGTRWVVGAPTAVSDWGDAVSGCDAVINLAGEPIAQRWTKRAMEQIVQSRVGVTTALYHALQAASDRPTTLISASAVGYYGTSEADRFDEQSPLGTGFLARVCGEWEKAATRSEPLVRVVRARFGVVLSRDGGALPKLAMPYRMLMGGPIGTGRQWMSWVHVRDAVRLVLFALSRPELRGPLNVTAPHPARNAEFSAELARALKVPNLLGAGKVWLRTFLGKMAQETILEGQRVLPEVALEHGFEFEYPTLAGALAELYHR